MLVVCEGVKRSSASTLRMAAAIVFTIAAFGTALSSKAYAFDDSFVVRATMTLCDGFHAGETQIEFKYRIGPAAEQFAAPAVASSIDLQSNSGTFDIRVPATMMRMPLRIVAYCRNGGATSDPSNEQSVTNCDHLALFDTDQDGVPNDQEDTDCSNAFSPADRSNPENIDTDGDGVRDLAELVSNTDPSDAGSSTRARILSGAPFDPDGDGDANPVAWRPGNGSWYIKDGIVPGQDLAFPFGLGGDIPFTYRSARGLSDVGVIRRMGTDYDWFFHGEGFLVGNGTTVPVLRFGNFGDNIVLGPWEDSGVTSPAVARLYNDAWSFYILRHTGEVRAVNWGRNGDIPMVSDYDGDGLFDIAVYRPSNQMLYYIRSRDGAPRSVQFGSGTADYSVRGDFTGDGRDDFVLWEPINGMFSMLKSDAGLTPRSGDARSIGSVQLGLYEVHVPLSWNRRDGQDLFTVVDHATGVRYTRTGNDPNGAVEAVQWGLPGDTLG